MKTMKKDKRCGYGRRLILLSLFCWALNSFFSGIALSAPADFPKKAVTIIVNFAPGGARDVLARGVAKTMSKYLGVPMVVMNMAGAGGARGLITLFHSAPDGYSIGVGSPTDIIDQVFEKRDYDNRKFSFIGRAQSSPTFFFVRSDSSFRSVRDFKTHGKPVRHGTPSLTQNSTVASMIISKRVGFPMVIVGGYQGSAATALGLVRGEIEFSGPTLSTATPFLQSAQIRPILTIHQKRYPVFPDIPTVVELGYPDVANFAIDFWFMAPPGVPKERSQILESALMKTLKDPEFLEWAKGAGVDVDPMSSEGVTKIASGFFGLLEQYRGDIETYIGKK